MKNRTARPPRSRFASYPASASRALPVVTGCPASPADRHPRPGCPPTASQSLVSGGHKQQRLRRQRDPWVRRTLGNPRGDAKQRQLIATSDRSAIDILVIGRQSPLRNRRSGLPGARGQPILMAALEHPDMREPCPDQHRDDIGAERRLGARSSWAVSITYGDGSSRARLAAVGRLVARVPTISLPDVCFLRVHVWHRCR